jgi:hypothetical protein
MTEGTVNKRRNRATENNGEAQGARPAREAGHADERRHLQMQNRASMRLHFAGGVFRQHDGWLRQPSVACLSSPFSPLLRSSVSTVALMPPVDGLR